MVERWKRGVDCENMSKTPRLINRGARTVFFEVHAHELNQHLIKVEVEKL
jgi:hypothetical protein